MSNRDDKIRKVQALLDGATTDGEREAAAAALRRLLDADAEPLPPEVAESFTDTVLAAIANREPLDGVTVRVARKHGTDLVQALVSEYRWRPCDDTYHPAPMLLG